MNETLGKSFDCILKAYKHFFFNFQRLIIIQNNFKFIIMYNYKGFYITINLKAYLIITYKLIYCQSDHFSFLNFIYDKT